MGLLRLSLVLALFCSGPALSHEFWIEPEEYQVETGAPLVASLRNGENFAGVSLGWFDNRFTRFEMVWRDETKPVGGRLGDTPALQGVAPPQDGLLVVLHETEPSSLTYNDWDKFLRFIEHKDFTEAATIHEERGWPKEGFDESYTRHAKALMAVGSGDGADRAFGLETEFVALTNPYAPDFDGRMRVRVEALGAPRADAQVEVFARAPDGSVAVTLHRTDAQGVAEVPVLPGHDYLFDAVLFRIAPEAGTTDDAPLWETLWAALTFHVPAR